MTEKTLETLSDDYVALALRRHAQRRVLPRNKLTLKMGEICDQILSSGPNGVSVLRDLLAHVEEEVRLAAASELLKLGDANAETVLRELARTAKVERVSIEAESALFIARVLNESAVKH